VTPFELFDVAEMKWRWRDYVDVPIQQELGEILDKMTVQATKKRYQSASEVLRDLPPAKAPSLSSPQPKPKSPLPSPSTATSGSQVELRSAVGYDYTRLQNLLVAGKWRQADEETANAMLKVTSREKEGWLREEDIDNFPCEDLRTIDRLWVKHSNGKFGFSVQKQIYQDLGGTRQFDKAAFDLWRKFGDTVGWRKEKLKQRKILGIPVEDRLKREWIYYTELDFDLYNSPKGHLPWASPVFLSLSQQWGSKVRFFSFAQKLINCNI
jgi:hypothetical protein